MAEGRNYVRQGDAFSALVQRGAGPRTVTHWQNNSTGRLFYRRVPVHACYALRASDAAEMMRECAAEPGLKGVTASWLASMLVIDWEPQAYRSRPRLDTEPRELRSEVRVTMTVSETGRAGERGARYWLVCPHCSRRCGVVYASEWDRWGGKVPGQVVTGCRECLGLTDHSRQSHKTPSWASAVLQQRPYKQGKNGRYAYRGAATLERAYNLETRSWERLNGRLEKLLSGGKK